MANSETDSLPSDRAIVPFVSVENILATVHSYGIERCLRELTAHIRHDLTRSVSFDKVRRVASHSPVGVIELMPVTDGTNYAFKFVYGHPSNTRMGLQTVTAFGVVGNVATGHPDLFSEVTILTALRTAATSALATRVLATKSATTAAIIGNGAQSEFQILALSAVCGIDTYNNTTLILPRRSAVSPIWVIRDYLLLRVDRCRRLSKARR